MRVLHVSTRLILGGSQENTVLSCEGQARLGHEVHLAFGPIYGPEGSLLGRVEAFNARVRRGEEQGTRIARGWDGQERVLPITLHTVPELVREVSPLKDWRCRDALRKLIERVRPQVVHTHSSKAGVVGRAAAWESRLDWKALPWWTEDASRALGPFTQAEEELRLEVAGWAEKHPRPRRPAVVHTIHGPPFMPLEGSPLRRLLILMKNAVYARAERYAAARCDVIVSVADAMTSQFLARGIGRAEQFVTVRSGMEAGAFLTAHPGETRAEARRELGLAEGDFVVGTVARLAQHKGHDDLLDALGEELRREPSWKLLWVGDGWFRERLAARVRDMGLDGRVVFTGLVPPERVAGLIRAMDVLAHPSYREGLPRTVPQALLCGVCPVVYDVDGAGEVCRDGETGLLVRAGDIAGLRGAVRRLYDEPERRREMAARGREFCRVRFSAETMIDELEKVYRRAIEMALRV